MCALTCQQTAAPLQETGVNNSLHTPARPRSAFGRLVPAWPRQEIHAQLQGFTASYLSVWPETQGQGPPGGGLLEPAANPSEHWGSPAKSWLGSLHIYLGLQEVLGGKRIAIPHLGKETPQISSLPLQKNHPRAGEKSRPRTLAQ